MRGWGKRPAYYLGAAALAGSLFVLAPPPVRLWIALGSILLPVLLPLPSAGHGRRILFLVCAAVAILAGIRTRGETAREARLRDSSAFTGSLLVQGVAEEEGLRGPRGPKGPRGLHLLLPVRLVEAEGDGCRFELVLSLDTAAAFLPGDRIEGRFDWKGRRLSARGELSSVRPERSLERSLHFLRARFDGRIARLYPGSASFLRAVILGERREIEGPVYETLRATGTLHLVAVSGLNVAFLVATGWFLFRPFPRIARDLLLLAAVALYALLVEGGHSVTRAAIGAGIFLLADLVGRPADAANAWGCGALASLAIDPLAARDSGFLLSYGGVFALFHWMPFLLARVPPRAAPYLSPFLGACAVETGLAPIVAARFTTFAPYAVLANAILVPTMGLWYPAACLGLLFPPAAGVIDRLVLLWLGVVERLSEIPGSLLPTEGIPAPVQGIYAACWFLLPLGEVPRRFRILLFATLIVAAGLSIPAAPERGAFIATICDVGQGDAILLRFPDGAHWMIDAGRSSRAARRALAQAGVARIETLLLTHPDLDHAGGAEEVLRIARPSSLYLPARMAKAPGFRPARAMAERLGTAVVFIEENPVRGNRHGVSIELRAGPGPGENNRSLLLSVDSGALGFLFTGDLEAQGESALASTLHEAEILKVGHHGSATSSETSLLDAVRPRLAVVSVGKENSYGHPAPEVLARFASRGIRVLRTDEDGPVEAAALPSGRIRIRYEPAR